MAGRQSKEKVENLGPEGGETKKRKKGSTGQGLTLVGRMQQKRGASRIVEGSQGQGDIVNVVHPVVAGVGERPFAKASN